MISVENFYWSLWQHLLLPSNLHCFYYYPWGTQNHLSEFEYTRRKHRSDYNHVLFHFDQEPLYSHSPGKIYDARDSSWGFHKWAKILANSERSQLKRNICTQRHFLDWYFFYHGFAALDWYRDGQYIEHEHEITTAYLCFNHLVQGRRSYRIGLLARLLDSDSVNNAAISFHGSYQDIVEEIQDPDTMVSERSQRIIHRNLGTMRTMPWTVDQVLASGDLSARFGYHEHRLWQSSFMHVVTETVFYEPKLHLTEKVFKPIVAGRPFVLVSSPGALEYLREYGFKTFAPWIDESYDTITDHEARLDAIALEISRLHAMPLSELKTLLAEMQPIMEHNRRHFFGRFRKIIVDELVDNFDRCLRIWNNGRVDGRNLAVRPDLDTVKQILLR